MEHVLLYCGGTGTCTFNRAIQDRALRLSSSHSALILYSSHLSVQLESILNCCVKPSWQRSDSDLGEFLTPRSWDLISVENCTKFGCSIAASWSANDSEKRQTNTKQRRFKQFGHVTYDMFKCIVIAWPFSEKANSNATPSLSPMLMPQRSKRLRWVLASTMRYQLASRLRITRWNNQLGFALIYYQGRASWGKNVCLMASATCQQATFI